MPWLQTVRRCRHYYRYESRRVIVHRPPLIWWIELNFQSGDEAGESGQLMQYVIDSSSTMKQQLKLIKRRLPLVKLHWRRLCFRVIKIWKFDFQDDNVIKSGLSNKTLANLKQANEQVGKAMAAICISSKLVLQTVTLIGGEYRDDVVVARVMQSLFFYRNGNFNYQRPTTRTAVRIIRKSVRARRSRSESKSENVSERHEYGNVTARPISARQWIRNHVTAIDHQPANSSDCTARSVHQKTIGRNENADGQFGESRSGNQAIEIGR